MSASRIPMTELTARAAAYDIACESMAAALTEIERKNLPPEQLSGRLLDQMLMQIAWIEQAHDPRFGWNLLNALRRLSLVKDPEAQS